MDMRGSLGWKWGQAVGNRRLAIAHCRVTGPNITGSGIAGDPTSEPHPISEYAYSQSTRCDVTQPLNQPATVQPRPALP